MPTKKNIEIITDSTCDIPQALIDEYGIQVLPHILIWGEQEYRDRIDIQPDEFYRRLSLEKTLPTTSQVSVQYFSDAFNRAYENGAEAVVVILLSRTFSGALQSAEQAAQTAPLPVYIHDSRSVTMGLGWQVLAAARAREAGGGINEIMAALAHVQDRVCLYITLNNLDYLAHGGRIGNASRLLGTLLNIKPVIYVDPKTGINEPAGMAVTRSKALDMLYRKFFDRLSDQGKKLHVAVMHADAAQEAAALFERIKAEFHPMEILMDITGPVLALNVGPQTVELCGYCE